MFVCLVGEKIIFLIYEFNIWFYFVGCLFQAMVFIVSFFILSKNLILLMLRFAFELPFHCLFSLFLLYFLSSLSISLSLSFLFSSSSLYFSLPLSLSFSSVIDVFFLYNISFPLLSLSLTLPDSPLAYDRFISHTHSSPHRFFYSFILFYLHSLSSLSLIIYHYFYWFS